MVKRSELKSLSEIFHEGTKIKSVLKPPKRIPPLWTKIHFKSYPRFEQIKLPPNKKIGLVERIISERRSQRNFSNKPLSIKEISHTLFFSAGITLSDKNPNNTRRAYPSAGARYPLEIYVANKVSRDLPAGVYHYNTKSNTLEKILSGDYRKKNCQNDWSELVRKGELDNNYNSCF